MVGGVVVVLLLLLLMVTLVLGIQQSPAVGRAISELVPDP
jgi:hypothetical protein